MLNLITVMIMVHDINYPDCNKVMCIETIFQVRAAVHICDIDLMLDNNLQCFRHEG